MNDVKTTLCGRRVDRRRQRNQTAETKFPYNSITTGPSSVVLKIFNVSYDLERPFIVIVYHLEGCVGQLVCSL